MASKLKQLGAIGLKRYGPYIYEEFLPNLRWPQAGRVYKEMSENDPVIGAVLYLAEMLVRGTDWTVVPASTKTDEDKRAAEFVESCMHDMEISWADLISEILSMFIYGFSFHEVVYKVRRGPDSRSPKYRSKYSDGKIGFRNIPIRSQSSLTGWVFNDYEPVGFEQTIEPTGKRVVIPFSRGLLFRTRVARGNPEGKSLLRNAYRPWYFKKHFEEIEGIGIERDLAGLPVLQPPDNIDLWNDEDPEMVALRSRAETLVANIRRDSEEGILLPFGWSISLLTSNSSRQIDVGSIIERYDKRIAITMLSDVILLGENSGSFALAETKQSMLAASLQTQLFNIADVFNNVAIPRLFKVNNWYLKEYPRIVPGYIQTPSLKEVALMLRAMGLKINDDMELQNYLRQIMNMPLLDESQHHSIYSSSAPINNMDNKGGNAAGPDDTSQKTFEQNDMNYIGGEL